MPPIEAVGIVRATASALADDLKRLCGYGVLKRTRHHAGFGRTDEHPAPTEDELDLWHWTSISRGL